MPINGVTHLRFWSAIACHLRTLVSDQDHPEMSPEGWRAERSAALERRAAAMVRSRAHVFSP